MRQQASEKERTHPAWWDLIGLLALAVLTPFQMAAQAGEQEQVAVTASVATEAQVAAVAPEATAPPARPAPPKGTTTWYRVGDRDSYVVKLGGGAPAMIGSQSCQSGVGKQYTIRDEATIRELDGLFKPGQPLTEQAERQFRALLDKAVASGLAQEVK